MTSHYSPINIRISGLHRMSAIAFCSVFVYFSPCSLADTEHTTLRLKPSECVIMEQGQECHATAKLSWDASAVGDYCLHSSLTTQPLKCWDNSHQGTYRESVVTKESVQYTLKRNHEDFALAKAKLNVSWVYRKSIRPTRQWRLF